jgi:hypothetical protein
MRDTGETFRLATGIFYGQPQLGRAVGDLIANGFTRRQTYLAGTREALGTMMKETSAGSPRQFQPLYRLSDGVEVVTTSSVLLRRVLKEAAGREEENNFYSWLLPELFGRFSDHIRRNAIVLVVSAPDSGLHRRGSRILLRHSDHTVQTHEFSLMRACPTFVDHPAGSREGPQPGPGPVQPEGGATLTEVRACSLSLLNKDL